MSTTVHQEVQDYYGEELQHSDDLKNQCMLYNGSPSKVHYGSFEYGCR